MKAIALILLLIVLAGCTGSSVETNEQFRTGYSTAALSFVKNSPPTELPEDAKFSIGIDVQNRGAGNITKGILSITYDTDYVEMFSSSTKTIDLQGRSLLNKEGEERPYFFESKTKNLDIESQRRDVPIIVNLCYPYIVTLEDTICLDKPYETGIDRGEAVCTLKDLSYNGQGGPVGISKVDVTMLSSENSQTLVPVFDIEIKHGGQGLVTDVDTYRSACSSKGATDAYNVVKIIDARLSDIPLNCNKQTITLRDGTGRVRCEAANPIPSYLVPYTAPIVIQLEYGYLQSLTTNLQIVNT